MWLQWPLGTTLIRQIADSDIKSLEASQDYLISIGMIPSDKKVDIQSMILH